MLRRAVHFALLLVVWLAVSPAFADALHILQLRHRPANEMQPLIQPLLGADEALSGSGYQLFLRASEPRRQEIERLIAALDVAPRQLTVSVRQSSVRGERRARDTVSGEIEIDRGRAGGVQAENEGIRYRGERRTASDADSRTQVLRVQEGQRAYIRIGQSVPVVERVLALTGRRNAVLAEGVRFEEFSSGFDVLPRMAGETVRLEITPRLAVSGARDGRFAFTELQTTISVRPGQWVEIGALLKQSSAVNRAILSGAVEQTDGHVTIEVRVD